MRYRKNLMNSVRFFLISYKQRNWARISLPMKKKIALVLSIFIATPVVLAGIFYLIMSFYYAESYMFGTFINGVYATGKTPEEINEYLLEKKQIKSFHVTDKTGKEFAIPLEEIGYSNSYLDELQEIYDKQNPFLWFAHMDNTIEYKIEPIGLFDEEKLEEVFGELEFIKNASNKNNLKVEIDKDQDGYVLVDTTKNLIDTQKAQEVVEEALSAGKSEVNLTDEDCYDEIEYTKEMKETLELFEKVERFISAEITYKFDTKDVVVDRKVVSDFIKVDENGDFLFDETENLILDEELIKAYIEELAEEFDTVNKDRTFRASRGEMVVVPAGTYGNKLDQKKEIEYLTDAIANGTKEEHEPIYSQRAWGRGANDIGDTYIEVDMTNQKLYYYEGGAQIINTDVVTGNISQRNGTPAKACYVYFMQKKRILRGEDYATPVDYWMAVYGNIGIHDATWRGKFGGNIYRTNGSHGCINTPYKEVSKLYSRVKIGTPVMIFY